MTSGPKNKLRDQHELYTAAQQINAIAHNENRRVALIGGLAMQIYGSPRLTSDIDIVVGKPVRGLRPESNLTFGGYQSTTPNGVPVDVVIRDDDYAPLYEAALNHAVIRRGIPIRIVRPEYLAAMKLAADRPKDTFDLDFLITESPIDLTKTLRIVRKYMGVYGAQEFQSRVDIAKWKKETGKL